MLTEERFSCILDRIHARGSATVTELSQMLGVSESTVRRDLSTLDDMGRLNKVHGGACRLTEEPVTSEPSVMEKETICVEEKKTIGRYAATMINDDDFVFIDAGTTTRWMIEYIEHTKATFVTNGIMQAKLLAAKNLHTYMIGGFIKPVTEAVIGAEGVNALSRYNFTKSFIGTNGIHIEAGFTTVDVEEARIKSEAISRSYANIVLADHTKFDQISAITFAPIEKVCIITDAAVKDKYKEATIIKEVM